MLISINIEEERVYLLYNPRLQSTIKGNQGRNLKAALLALHTAFITSDQWTHRIVMSKAGAMEENGLWSARFPRQLRTTCLGVVPPWALLHHQQSRQSPIYISTVQSTLGSFSVESFLTDDSRFYQLTVKVDQGNELLLIALDNRIETSGTPWNC